MIFSPDKMWQCAVKQMGTQQLCMGDDVVIVLDGPEDVAELYKALQEAHWEAVADYEGKL